MSVLPMTDADILAAIDSEVCPCCQGWKRAGASFCREDYLALTLAMRLGIGGTPSATPQFCDAFRRALRHLQGLPERKHRIAEGPNGRAAWPHHSHDDLECAGYRLLTYTPLGYVRCSGCGVAILWYRTPRGRALAVNYDDSQPHFLTCRRPPRRAVKTSARRRNA